MAMLQNTYGIVQGVGGPSPQDLQTNQAQQERQQQLKLQAGQFGFETGQNALNRQLAQWTTGQEQAGQTERANIAAQAQELPAQLQQQRFGTVFPWMQQQFGNLMNQYGHPGGSGPGSGYGQGPNINVGGVWTPQQVQQQVNASRAHNDQATAAETRQMQGRMAGQGYGANSPLAAALAGQMQAQNLATNTQNTAQVRQNAAQLNAQHLLSTQQAAEQQYASRQQEAIAQQQIAAQRQNALIAALAGIV